MELPPLLRQQLLHPAPQRRFTPEELRELKQHGNSNAILSYLVQRDFHRLFATPSYPSVAESIRAKLRTIQCIAFEGFCAPDALFQDVERECAEQQGEIYRTIHRSIGAIRSEIVKQSHLWRDITAEYGGEVARLNQSTAAVNLFAGELGSHITVFGSARKKQGTPEYESARWLTRTLVTGLVDEDMHKGCLSQGEHVLTGAGPNIMEAANLGGMEGKIQLIETLKERLRDRSAPQSEIEHVLSQFHQQFHSVGIRIDLPFEVGWNDHLEMNLSFKHFAPRKHGLMAGTAGRTLDEPAWDRSQEGFYCPPDGRHPAFFILTPGIGTKDEGWEALCLEQTKKMPPIPIFAIGKATRETFEKALDVMEREATIDPDRDRKLLKFCRDEVDAVEQYLSAHKLQPSETIQKAIHDWKPLMDSPQVSIFNGNGPHS